jgi:hypothetical protein
VTKGLNIGYEGARDVNGDRLAPDFLYIGTSKAGSTWLFNALAVHPEVFLASDKGLYYFDSHYSKGQDWYLEHFAGAGSYGAAGCISHSYLSSDEAPSRIAALNPGMRLLVCLREPVDRAFSDYLDLVKNQQYDGSFETALEQFPRLLGRGHYARYLEHYRQHFPDEQMLVQLFDDLKADPQRYADECFRFLGVGPLTLAPTALKRTMVAGTPRNAGLASAAKSASVVARRLGLRKLRSRVKRSTAIRQALYRPYGADRPTLDPALAAQLRGQFADEVHELDALLGVPVSHRWGY